MDSMKNSALEGRHRQSAPCIASRSVLRSRDSHRHVFVKNVHPSLPVRIADRDLRANQADPAAAILWAVMFDLAGRDLPGNTTDDRPDNLTLDFLNSGLNYFLITPNIAEIARRQSNAADAATTKIVNEKNISDPLKAYEIHVQELAETFIKQGTYTNFKPGSILIKDAAFVDSPDTRQQLVKSAESLILQSRKFWLSPLRGQNI